MQIQFHIPNRGSLRGFQQDTRSRDLKRWTFVLVPGRYRRAGSTYRYRIEVLDEVGRKLLFDTDPITVPTMPLTLYQNHSNPCNTVTAIKNSVLVNCQVTLGIYDVSGRSIACLVAQKLIKGRYNMEWDVLNTKGKPVSSGTYLYRLTAGKETVSRKMILLR